MKLEKYPIVILSTCVRCLTANGVLYEPAEGHLDYIDFEDCYQRWFAYELSHQGDYYPSRSEAEFRKMAKTWKEVGARDALAGQPYIIFYTVPQICLKFETYEEISEFRRCMYDLGAWSTFDLA